VKRSAAEVNVECGNMAQNYGSAIIKAADEVLSDIHSDMFPLVIWQTGSGTQSNMNMNEVLANRACQILGGNPGDKSLVHPNNHVNMGQSSNDVFPTAIHIATAMSLHKSLYSSLDALISSLDKKAIQFDNIVKIGRTHLMDAVPMTVGDEFSAWRDALRNCKSHIQTTEPLVLSLAQGGTAVGTGLNCAPGFPEAFAKKVADFSHLPFVTNPNKFTALSFQSPMVAIMGSLNTLATTLLKIANDVRLLGSGPRAGLGELNLPANEPGSSIMPGKVNPTQCESLAMLSAQVMGNAVACSVGNCFGHLQLNVFLPLVGSNVLRSIALLSCGMTNFEKNCISGTECNQTRCDQLVHQSLMLVTSLNPKIGYDKAAEAALNAHQKGLTLKESVLELGCLSADEFDRLVDAKKMAKPNLDK